MSEFTKQYEITFIVDPVLSSDEIKATAQTYVDLLTSNGCTIVHVDEMGLRQLAYPINRRTSGVYYTIEFTIESGEVIGTTELAFRRDERIMRFLTVRLDKYGIKYNEDKRNGLIGKGKKEEKEADKEPAKESKPRAAKAKAKPAAPKADTAVAEAPKEEVKKEEAPKEEAPKAEVKKEEEE
ncbi:MAG: 30S ribosomal protein S6 [Bacteroidota bacterium]